MQLGCGDKLKLDCFSNAPSSPKNNKTEVTGPKIANLWQMFTIEQSADDR
jgi:hypothetical protein